MSILPPSGAEIPLGPGKAFIESFMVDQCVITRDSQGVMDDVLDQVTGLLVRPGGDTTTVYTGKCIFKPLSARGRTRSTEVGGFMESMFSFRVDVPQSVSDVRQGDIVTCTASENDDRLVGRPFRVVNAGMGTHRTYRQLMVEDLTYRVKPED